MLHSGFKRTDTTFGLFYTNAFLCASRKKCNCFVRKRKLTPRDIAFFLLNKKNRDLETEIIDFNKYLRGGITITKQGFSKARLNFRAEVFKYVNDFHLKNLYDIEPEVKKFHNRFVIAIDGSDIPVPTTSENILYFGNAAIHQKNENVSNCAMASASTAYDVLNKFILDSEITGYKIDERKYAVQHVNHIKEILPNNSKCIYIMDRGYPSLSLIISLIETNTEFVIRLPKITFKAEQLSMTCNDEVKTVKIDNTRINPYRNTEFAEKLRNIKSLDLRFTRTEDDEHSEQYIVSNLSTDEFSYDEIQGLYKLRWRIETMYNCLKHKLQLCHFSGIKPDVIKQDFYSTIFLYNLMSDFEQQQFEDEDIPYDDLIFKVNDNRTIGVLKRKLIELIMEEKGAKRGEIFKEIVTTIRRNLVKIKENRNYARSNVKRLRESKNGYKQSF